MELSNTPLDSSAPTSWLSDFDMDDYNFFLEECNLDIDDKEFLSHDIASAMQGNTSSNSSSITENLSQKLSPSSSILSFDQSASHSRDHIIAERKRRKKLSQSFIALAALIPGLKKMDKASILGDAIKHAKELKERVAILEEDSKKTRVVVLKNGDNDDSSSCDDESIENASGSEQLLQVEARMSGQEVLLRIHCHRQKGLLVKILEQIQSLNLFVVNSSVLPFGDSTLEITFIAQMGEDYNLTIKDLVKNIRMATLKCLSVIIT
ncbi:putative transcription factor bHLH family [Lupinus albus]|uniref:Putative transcription factor bHLH family n=1 Tax=Lupinus albus TaxID=3870 RepID=A0A6A4QIG6_LUPAL|nr:putative transcription factor bHLH family [Lupinus albus]